MGCHLEKLSVLLLAQVLLKIHVQGGTAVQILDIVLSVELELVNYGYHIILRVIEIRAV